MNEKIREFENKHEPKFKLKKYTDEILYLIDKGFSQDQVLLFLKESYNVSATRQTLSSHLKFLKKTNKTVRAEPQKKQSESEIKSKAAAVDYKLPKTESLADAMEKMRARAAID